MILANRNQCSAPGLADSFYNILSHILSYLIPDKQTNTLQAFTCQNLDCRKPIRVHINVSMVISEIMTQQ